MDVRLGNFTLLHLPAGMRCAREPLLDVSMSL
jgi:hypothetical protein